MGEGSNADPLLAKTGLPDDAHVRSQGADAHLRFELSLRRLLRHSPMGVKLWPWAAIIAQRGRRR